MERWIIEYVQNQARISAEATPLRLDANFDVMRPWPDDMFGHDCARSSVKDEHWLVSLNTSTRNFSVSSCVSGVTVISLPKFLSNLVG